MIFIVRELDSKDHKILYHLFLNSRQSLSSISKKVGLQKSVVEYRIKRLQTNGIIKNFNAMVDIFKLGFSVYRLNIVLQYASPDKEKEIINHFVNHNNTWSIASTKGRYDLIITILVKSPNYFYSFYEQTLRQYRNFFKEIFFSQLYESFGYEHSLLLNELSSSHERTYEYRDNGLTVDVDLVDYKILNLLAKNTRINSVELAKQINVSTVTIQSRIKKLIKSGVIKRYSITMDINKLGLREFIVNLSLRDYAKKNQIITYLSDNPFLWEINKAIGGCDLEITLYATNFEHFYRVMEDLRKKFPDDIANYDYLYVTEVFKSNVLPEKE
ncbi:HTH-type transcriptional regulator Ptr1 [uncultured archaeon]|nr:HTH-type transcriptional regulator Ptr1 [uncultured archaeon]